MTKMACPFTVITEKVVVQILFDCMAYSFIQLAAQDDELKRLRQNRHENVFLLKKTRYTNLMSYIFNVSLPVTTLLRSTITISDRKWP